MGFAIGVSKKNREAVVFFGSHPLPSQVFRIALVSSSLAILSRGLRPV